jgi:hypothetical protein
MYNNKIVTSLCFVLVHRKTNCLPLPKKRLFKRNTLDFHSGCFRLKSVPCYLGCDADLCCFPQTFPTSALIVPSARRFRRVRWEFLQPDGSDVCVESSFSQTVPTSALRAPSARRFRRVRWEFLQPDGYYSNKLSDTSVRVDLPMWSSALWHLYTHDALQWLVILRFVQEVLVRIFLREMCLRFPSLNFTVSWDISQSLTWSMRAERPWFDSRRRNRFFSLLAYPDLFHCDPIRFCSRYRGTFL